MPILNQCQSTPEKNYVIKFRIDTHKLRLLLEMATCHIKFFNLTKKRQVHLKVQRHKPLNFKKSHDDVTHVLHDYINIYLNNVHNRNLSNSL